MSDQPQQVYNGRYELHRLIARGGMAEVFLARDALLDRPVALKVLFPEFATDPSFVERFRREAQSAANLSHPNIVSVYDWGEEDGTYFIVMEYVEGRSLAQIIKDEGPLHPDRAADITADTAAALGFAHRNGVVHRDVKPGNILINPSGTVKVADFGIARAVSTSENLTQTGTVMGTATYFSPEQARGESVDPRSDVYSLGVVLYEMLTGRPPFSGDSPVSVAYKHVQETPETPRARNPDVPTALEAVTLKTIAKNPANRYATGEDLRADLRRFRAGQPVTAEAIMAAPGADATRAVYAGTAATTAVPHTGGTRAVREVEERYWDDEPPREKKSSAAFVIALLVLLAILAALLYFFTQSLGLGDEETGATVETPSVLSLPAAEATRILTEAGLDPEITEEPNESVPDGTVFAQDPAAGVNVPEGSTVELRVSAGAPPVEVPSVVGMNLSDAVSQLEGLGLSTDVTPAESETTPEGQVMSQEPGEGEEVPAGTAVELTVSSGPPSVPVPDVVGFRSNEAGVELGRAGFEVAFREEPSDSVDEGLVIRTDPAAGAEHTKGSTVTVIVSSGPAEAEVPDVVDMSDAEATAALQKAGFRVARSSQAVADESKDGVVLSQSPRGGATAPAGSTVTITVGEFVGSETTSTTSTSSTTSTTSTTAASGGGTG
ncbi:MAG: Stk1 family PASTA domain-containing Ser/Thr kinase [Acidimicrobiales bacterium]